MDPHEPERDLNNEKTLLQSNQNSDDKNDDDAADFAMVLSHLDLFAVPGFCLFILSSLPGHESDDLPTRLQPTVGSAIYGSSHVLFPISFSPFSSSSSSPPSSTSDLEDFHSTPARRLRILKTSQSEQRLQYKAPSHIISRTLTTTSTPTTKNHPKWLLKIPQHGTPSSFSPLAAEALVSEAKTMHLLAQNTQVPIPAVIAFDASLSNDLGVPFILLEYVEGKSLFDVWFDKNVTEEELWERRCRTLRGVAAAMVQLGRWEFERGGRPVFSEDGEEITGVGEVLAEDMKIDLDRVIESMGRKDKGKDADRSSGSEDGNTPTFYAAGPFDDVHAYFNASFERLIRPSSGAGPNWGDTPHERGRNKLLSFFLSWLPSSSTPSYPGEQPFVLSHPNLDTQNVLVAPDGELLALLDWEGVAAVPRCVGNESYPSWLTRDWDPTLYGWREGHGIMEGALEDEPEVLQKLRVEYESILRESLRQENERRGIDNSWNSGLRTRRSLYYENLCIACGNPITTFGIVEKFVEEIASLVKRKVDLGDSFLDETLKNYTDLEEAVGTMDMDSLVNELEGDLDPIKLQLLKRGFDALLTAD